MASVLERLAQRLDLPEEAVAGAPKVTVTGTDRVVIENHRGLLGYTEQEVEAACAHGRVRVRGAELLLRAMDEEVLVVTGRIFCV